MKTIVNDSQHSGIVKQRGRKSPEYRKTFERTIQQIDLAMLLREMRENAGLTQSELAKKVGTTQSAIARLERGGRPPRIDTLLRIADALDCELLVELVPR